MSPTPPRTSADRASSLLRERMRAVFKQLPKGLGGNEEAVHQMRVAGRRLRVAIPLLAKKPEGKRAKRALRVLRELTRAAGGSRDKDVGLLLLDAHLREQSVLTPEQIAVRRRLRATRQRSRSRMAEALMDLEIARLRRDLRRILARKADDVFAIMSRLRAEREVRGGALLVGFAALATRYDPESLHALRRQVRRLRYAAEVMDSVRDEDSGSPAIFKALQEQIGALHDVHVLARWLEAQATATEARGRPSEALAARALQAAFDTKGREIHTKLLEGQPGEVVARALAAMGRSKTAA